MASGYAGADGKPAVEPSESRGELLYETHCIGCHTSVAHLRERRAKTLAEIAQQVTRWQTNTGLAWTGEDVSEVVAYLNRRFYKLPESVPASGQGRRSD